MILVLLALASATSVLSFSNGDWVTGVWAAIAAVVSYDLYILQETDDNRS